MSVLALYMKHMCWSVLWIDITSFHDTFNLTVTGRFAFLCRYFRHFLSGSETEWFCKSHNKPTYMTEEESPVLRIPTLMPDARGATASLLYRHHDNISRLPTPWCAHGIDWFKGQDFASSVMYVGLLWDLQNHSVSLPDKKCLKYLPQNANLPVTVKLKVSWKEVVLSIHSTLQHICFHI